MLHYSQFSFLNQYAQFFYYLNKQAMGDQCSKCYEKLRPSRLQSSVKIKRKTYRKTQNIEEYTGSMNVEEWSSEDYEKFIEGVSFIRSAESYLNEITYSDDNMVTLCRMIVDCLTHLKKTETNQLKTEINAIVQKHREQLIQKTITYRDLVPEIKKAAAQKELALQQVALSRSFNKIAQLVRNQKLDEKKIEKVYLKKFYKKVQYPYYANYANFSQKQIEQIIKLELVEYRMEKFGQKFEFKFRGMKEDSIKINGMLIDCFEKYSKNIQAFSYDLSEKESLLAADISRRACQFHDLGIFILLEYFVRCCRNLQNNGESAKEIDKKLVKVLDKIKEKYPPGVKYDKENKEFEALNKLEMHGEPLIRQSELTGDKEARLEQIIAQNAQLAENNLQQFEDLLRNTCLQRSISVKTGLKLKPSKINEISQKKAVIRIKEKMLLKGKSDITYKIDKSKIDELLGVEGQKYKNIIKDQLKSLNKIQFKVSDMLRGKCTFITLSDIIETVTELKKYISQHSDEGLRIIEIQDRFSGETPISDVTLKIGHKDEVTSELQLSLQTNKAAYDFAHKIYEFVRCKVFSKIKIIHNYYEQYSKQIRELIGQALLLSETNREQGLYVHSDAIRNFFEINDQLPRTFQQILSQELRSKREQLGNIEEITEISDLLEAIFLRKMYLEQENMANRVLEIIMARQNKSKIYLGIVFSQLYKDIELDDLSIYENWYSYLHYLNDFHEILLNDKWTEKILLSPEAVIKLLELIHLFKVSRDGEIKEYEQHIQNLYGGESLQICRYEIKKGKIKDYCKQRKESNRIFLSVFSKLKRINEANLSKLQIDKLNGLKNSVELLVAESYLKLEQSDEARNIISSIMSKFRQGQPTVELILCELLNSECQLYENVKKFFDIYRKTVKKADSFGISFRGLNIAECQYRIGQYLWRKGYKKEALDTHFRNAFEEFGRFMIGKQLYTKMCEVWSNYSEFKIEEPKLSANGRLRELSLQNRQIDSKKCYYLSKVNWPQLTQLNLWDNDVGDEGCKYLCQAKWPKLRKLNLYQNRIGQKGCQYLKSSNWPELDELVLSCNNFGPKGCKHLASIEWKGLNRLSLYECSIGDEGCEYLSSSQWPNLSWLNINSNKISSEGCKYIISANWPNLVELRIWNNSIGSEGCKYLSESGWSNLTKLNLWNNKIDSKGCYSLSRAKWMKIKVINLASNNLNKQDIAELKNSFPKTAIAI